MKLLVIISAYVMGDLGSNPWLGGKSAFTLGAPYNSNTQEMYLSEFEVSLANTASSSVARTTSEISSEVNKLRKRSWNLENHAA